MSNENMNKLNGAMSGFVKVENEISKMANDTGKKIGAMASDFAQSANQRIESGREYVEENPLKGVAIAAAAGAIVGSLLTIALRKK
jgi:ElaB/YqjD/DUF883 family membrane-anchored ribosome-binding protein